MYESSQTAPPEEGREGREGRPEPLDGGGVSESPEVAGDGAGGAGDGLPSPAAAARPGAPEAHDVPDTPEAREETDVPAVAAGAVEAEAPPAADSPPTDDAAMGRPPVSRPPGAPADTAAKAMPALDTPPWTFRQTLIGVGLTLGPWLLLVIGSQLAGRSASPAPPRHLPPGQDIATGVVLFAVSAVLEGLFLIAPLVYAFRALPPDAAAPPWDWRGRSSWIHLAGRLRMALDVLGLRRPAAPARRIALYIAVAIGAILVASYLYQVVLERLHSSLQTNADVLLRQARYMPYSVVATLLVAVLVAPLCEELFFRGFAFPGLARGMRPWWAVAASALLFALAHADVGSSVLLLVMGVALAVVRWRTRSVWPGVLLHTLNNTFALIVILALLRG